MNEYAATTNEGMKGELPQSLKKKKPEIQWPRP
jgi:hypothetical protein